MAFDNLKRKLQSIYVSNHVKQASIPEFEPSHVIRQHFVFTGNVQGVGFRYEVYGIARRIGLTGWVRNNDDFSVEAELQGEQAKVAYLVQFMKDLKRARVDNVVVGDLELKENEHEFELRI